MDTKRLIEKFSRLGARVKVHDDGGARVSIDVRHDRRGEYFDLAVQRGVTVDAIDVRPRDRHLLLAVHDEDAYGAPIGSGQRFLCGHDERAWFVAAIPEGRPASNVAMAKDALKPQAIRWAEQRAQVRFDHRHRRKTAAWVRQGEWFFVATPFGAPAGVVLRNEPLMRTGGKPHRMEYCIRGGGELVYVNRQNGQILSARRFGLLVRKNPSLHRSYVPQRQNMGVFARGRVSHPDHKTIVLRDWHQVFMNTENQAQAMRYVAFID